MNIAIVTSSGHFKYTRVTIESICTIYLNSGVKIFLFHQEWDASFSDMIKELKIRVRESGNILIDYPVTVEMVAEFSKEENFSRWRIETMIRLIVPKALEKIEKRVLILGTDVILNGNIDEFYNIDFEENYICASRDMNWIQHGDDLYWNLHKNWGYEKKKIFDNYVNSDVVLYNLSAIRKMKKSILEHYKKYKEYFPMLDQDVLNSFYMGKVKIVDYEKYNFIPSNLWGGKLDEKLREAKIIHYCGRLKPWCVGGIENTKSIFYKWWMLAKKTPYYDELLLECNKDNTMYEEYQRVNFYYLVLMKMMNFNNIETRLKYFFQTRNIYHVVVYGTGNVGKVLTNLLIKIQDIKVEVLDGLDKRRKCSQIMSNAEIIIITPMHAYEEIEKILIKKTKGLIISILELLQMIESEKFVK